MANSKHTPGPWTVGGKYAFKSVLLNARGESIASGGNNRAVQGPELEASLRLASAAPELLSLLEDWLTSFVDCIEGGEADEMVAASRAAIAKATGVAS